MWKRINFVLIGSLLAAVLVGGAVFSRSAAQAADKPKDKLALGETDVKQLILLMDTDKNGMVSKEEFMRFMEAEFDRLDKDKSGQLDVKELTQSQLRVVHSGHR